MTSHRDLVELFGETNVTTWSYSELRKIGLAPGSAHALSDVGLPQNTANVFTTQVEGAPSMFSVHEFQLGDEPVKILILGGPPGDQQMRYFLDVNDGVIGLFNLAEGRRQVEVINSTIHEFITFLHLYGDYSNKSSMATPGERRELTRRLSGRLKEQDSFAFDQPDSWWSVAIEQLRS
ncbi:SUKH-4 family immunity protein [Streptomyces sp. CA-132043]|uniref:SUKH-4 family immunity protein n=1 Tax=Streptomyces sp. CA-132043 TaxID=3240048 RepID=UPI003D8B8B82